MRQTRWAAAQQRPGLSLILDIAIHESAFGQQHVAGRLAAQVLARREQPPVLDVRHGRRSLADGGQPTLDAAPRRVSDTARPAHRNRRLPRTRADAASQVPAKCACPSSSATAPGSGRAATRPASCARRSRDAAQTRHLRSRAAVDDQPRREINDHMPAFRTPRGQPLLGLRKIEVHHLRAP